MFAARRKPKIVWCPVAPPSAEKAARWPGQTKDSRRGYVHKHPRHRAPIHESTPSVPRFSDNHWTVRLNINNWRHTVKSTLRDCPGRLGTLRGLSERFTINAGRRLTAPVVLLLMVAALIAPLASPSPASASLCPPGMVQGPDTEVVNADGSITRTPGPCVPAPRIDFLVDRSSTSIRATTRVMGFRRLSTM